MLPFQVASVLLLATTIRSAIGFGEALIAVPILALLMPVEIAAPVAVVASILVAAFVVAQDWRHIEIASARLLVISTLFGIPVGLLLLKTLPGSLLKGVLGAGILAFSGYQLARRQTRKLSDDRLAWVFGFLAGVFGGAYGLNGPPLAVYGTLRGWSPEKFRATLQGYFLPASLVGLIGYGFAGLWTTNVLRLSLYSLPSILLGVVLGRQINRRLKAESFVRAMHYGLCGVGALLLYQVLRG